MKNLQLNQGLIIPKLNEFLSSKEVNFKISNFELLNPSSGLERLSITINSVDYYINFYFTSKGKTTIQNQNFKDIQIIADACIYIKDNCQYECSPNNLTIATISVDELDILVEYLTEENASIINDTVTDPNSSHRYVIKSIYKDELTLTRYKASGKLLIQGSPLYLLDKLKDMIGQLDLGKLNELISEPIPLTDLEKELRSHLPNSYGKLSQTLKNNIMTSLALRNDSNVFNDYSHIPIPAFRGLEGLMWQWLSEYQISAPKEHSIGSCFENCPKRGYPNFIFKDEFANKIKNVAKKEKLEEIYKYHHNQRNQLVHQEFGYTNTIISSQTDAIEIVHKICFYINEFYDIVG